MKKDQSPIPVYFMPGMAANPSIFENIFLPKEEFEIFFLEWLIPDPNESLKKYAFRMTTFIKHKNPVLIGVSFGGVVVQEMAKYIQLKRLIIISSVKCRAELPKKMRFASKTGIFKLLPTGLLNYIDYFEKVAVGDFLKKRAQLYRQYLSINDKIYINWAIKNMVSWSCAKANPKLIHIHGSADRVFPARYIKNAILVEGGTHIMIINRFRWFNQYLPEIIKTGTFTKK